MGLEALALASPLRWGTQAGVWGRARGAWRHHCSCRQGCPAPRLPDHVDWGVGTTLRKEAPRVSLGFLLLRRKDMSWFLP